jgi:hypothetical protein
VRGESQFFPPASPCMEGPHENEWRRYRRQMPAAWSLQAAVDLLSDIRVVPCFETSCDYVVGSCNNDTGAKETERGSIVCELFWAAKA